MKAIHKSYHQPLEPVSRLLPLRRDEMDEIHRLKVRKAKPDTKGIQTPAHIPAAYSTRLTAMTGSKGLARNHSENTLKKKEELLQMARDIERIYQKILEQKSDYMRELWEDDWEKVKQMRDNISRHPQGVTNKQVLSPKALRSFWPLEPVASRIIQRRIDQKSYEIHLEKLSKVKPVVDTNIQTPAHTQHKLKKVEVLSPKALRSFWPLEPVASRIIQRRIDQKSYEIHLEKLSEVTHVVDTSIHTPAHCDR